MVLSGHARESAGQRHKQVKALRKSTAPLLMCVSIAFWSWRVNYKNETFFCKNSWNFRYYVQLYSYTKLLVL